MRVHSESGLVFLIFKLFDRYPDILHVITTRLAGVSRFPYRSLNLGIHAGDEEEAVLENRRLVANALGIDAHSITTGRQVHGTHIALITEEQRGRGAATYDEAIPDTDALVTGEKDLPLMILVADCTPVSFYDPVNGVIAIAHGSWRGTLHRIAQKTITAMSDRFGSMPKDIVAGIGPSIGPCCYEVGLDVVEPFEKAFPGQAASFTERRTKERAFLNLWEANRHQLLEAGIQENRIEVAGMCTSCRRDLFYSYRAEHRMTGRFAGIIMLRSR